MTTYTNFTVNQTGLNEIAEFLGTHHRLGRDHFTSDMLNAWAFDAEFQLSEGNPASIEIRSLDTASGHTETLTISAEGLDAEEIDIEE